MKLSQWAKNNNIHYQTAYGMFKRGEIPDAYQLPTGTIIIPEKTSVEIIKENIREIIRDEVRDEINSLKTTIDELKKIITQYNQEALLRKVEDKRYSK